MSLIREIDSKDKDLLSQVNQLVSNAFSYQAPHTFFDDFPVWASDRVTRLGIFSGLDLIAHVGSRLASLKTSHGSLTVALLGAVATRADFRQQGLSTELLHEAIARAKKAGAVWIFLWGSEHEFYRKLGFELQGLQARALISHLPGVSAQKFPQVKEGLTEEIFKTLCNQKTGIELGEKDRSWFFAHKTVQWFYVEKPFAFVGFERGMDLPHIIHEWGGDHTALKVLFSHILADDAEANLLGRNADLDLIGFDRADQIEEYLCLAVPAHPHEPWNAEFWISGLSAC